MQQEDIDDLITENDDEMTNEELLQIEYFPVDDVDNGEIIIHIISNTEGPGKIQAEKYGNSFLKKLKNSSDQLLSFKKNPKKREAFNLGVDFLTRYFV